MLWTTKLTVEQVKLGRHLSDGQPLMYTCKSLYSIQLRSIPLPSHKSVEITKTKLSITLFFRPSLLVSSQEMHVIINKLRIFSFVSDRVAISKHMAQFCYNK